MPQSISPKSGKVLRKVLIPVDGSIESKKALAWYNDNMKRDGDLVLFIHIIEPILPSALSALSYECESMPAGSSFHVPDGGMEKARCLFKELVHVANKHDINHECMIQIETRTGPALVKLIQEKEIDVVVMAKRDLGFWRRNFSQSITSYVLHHANVPVSIITPSDDK
ncbi:hypothetical protein MN116_006415 [Schistosoma mekongi]|uniref:UspA domain-containing protein n=1 Tax=Schistosoma mekongi TaxID=38744 RepID=A0AAE2D5I2_SCHME|nr:hypothetical protein MN116_006414 [Schistosoma mekongi]KAK4470905.1 hypothetical protein MN116_006415 [Schistosoma mekongi]